MVVSLNFGVEKAMVQMVAKWRSFKELATFKRTHTIQETRHAAGGFPRVSLQEFPSRRYYTRQMLGNLRAGGQEAERRPNKCPASLPNSPRSSTREVGIRVPDLFSVIYFSREPSPQKEKG